MLPQKLMYSNKISSAYARNFTSVLECQNTSEYSVGQTAIVNIPTMNNQFLSGADSVLSLKLRTRNADGANTIAYRNLNRCGIAGCIQRLRIFHGSNLLQDIDNYGTLASLLTSYQLGREDVEGKNSVLTGCDLGHGIDLNRVTGTDVPMPVSSEDEVAFAFPLLSILSMTDNYVPLFSLGNAPLRLEIQFVSNIEQFISSERPLSAPLTGKTFVDVKYIGNFVEVSDAGMQIIAESLQGRPLEWVCQSYANYVFNTNLPNAEKQVSMPVPAKFNSLKALYFVTREHFAGVATRPADDMPKFNLKEYSIRIGSKVIPSTKPNTTPQFLAEMERALGSVGNRVSPHSYQLSQIVGNASVTPAENVVTGAFAVGIETESYSSASMGSTYQGLNTSTDDIFFQPVYSANATAPDVRIDCWASYDQLITIENGQASVQF
jgi:hypothetical protein